MQIPKLPTLIYCRKKIGNHATCGKIATHCVTMQNKKENVISKRQINVHRCDAHIKSSTSTKQVVSTMPIDQSKELYSINKFLYTIIGKRISSTFHTAKYLTVKYVKENGGVMCFQEVTKKWKFVYFRQISIIHED